MGSEKAGMQLGKEIIAWTRSGKSLLATSPVKINMAGLRLAPQLEDDVVQVSRKFGLHNSTNMPSSPAIIPQAKLQEVIDKGLSLHQMASELNKPVATIRFYLDEYNIVSDSQREFRILKEYFSATTSESKAKAFDAVDKYLQQIAKDEFKLRKGTTFEDCLQDVRLRFLEEAEKSQKNGVNFSTSILRKVKNYAPELEQEFQTTSLEALEKAEIIPAIEDEAIRAFENKGYRLGHKRILSNNFLYDRDVAILNDYFIQGKTFEEIVEKFDLSPKRIKQLKDNALNRLKEKLAPYKDRLW